MRSADEIRRDPDYRYIDGEYDLAGYFSDPVHGDNARQRLAEVFADRDVIRDALEAAQRENERQQALLDQDLISVDEFVKIRAERDHARGEWHRHNERADALRAELTELRERLTAERDAARAEAEVSDGVAQMVADDRDEALANLEAAEAERDAAVAREARLRATVETIRAWATTRTRWSWTPAEVWPGIAAALASVPPETQPGTTDRLARILAKHQLADILPGGVLCTCGAELAALNPPLDDGTVKGEPLALAVHQLQETEQR